MTDELMDRVKSAPALPGAYLMRDRDGKVIYVGKANNLRHRVKAYFGRTDSRFMIPFLASKVYDVEFIVTETEKEALILENTLIKEHRPRYNVIFKDDKTYFNIRINPAEPLPWFQLVRRPKKDGAHYFGPYPSSASAKETLRFLQSIFPLRTCKDQELKSRKRPCLEYEIRRCLAPCVARIDASAYQRLVKDSMAFMEGREKKLIADLRARMNAASEQLHFEDAAVLRDRIAAIEETLEKQSVVSMSFKDRDVFGVYREGNLTGICVVYERKGKIIGIKNFPLLKIGIESTEILSSLMKQYYDGETNIPDEIIIPDSIPDHAVVKEWLSDKKGKKVSIVVPKRGGAVELLHIAKNNAESMFETQKHAADPEETICMLARVLRLKNMPPSRIECFDISNIGGKHAVGSMVTFVDGKPWNAGYRRFKIRTVPGADDYAMMYEVLNRRYNKKENLPDLIVVDGGKGQLGVAVSVLKDLNTEGIDVIGLAKEGKERGGDKVQDRVYCIGKRDPVNLSKWPAVLFLLQRIRDEAHRSAVTYHRKLKREQDFRSVLDAIPGIGASRKKALLRFFGDIRKIRESSVDMLQKVDGIGRQAAEKIHTFLRGEKGEKRE
jgi:excinuclease ABC subunit C